MMKICQCMWHSCAIQDAGHALTRMLAHADVCWRMLTYAPPQGVAFSFSKGIPY